MKYKCSPWIVLGFECIGGLNRFDLKEMKSGYRMYQENNRIYNSDSVNLILIFTFILIYEDRFKII